MKGIVKIVIAVTMTKSGFFPNMILVRVRVALKLEVLECRRCSEGDNEMHKGPTGIYTFL